MRSWRKEARLWLTDEYAFLCALQVTYIQPDFPQDTWPPEPFSMWEFWGQVPGVLENMNVLIS